jgi:hypothetical protein
MKESHKELIVRNFLLTIFITSFISCGTAKKNGGESREDLYEIIEKVKHRDYDLYYKTLSYEDLIFPDNFSYDMINRYNVEYNSISEKDRFVNFDNIFNEEQRKEIDDRIKNLKSVRLKAH